MLRETVVTPHGLLEIELDANLRYRLRCGEVEYANGVKKVRGRTSAYELRSVEQLRYDFERDVKAALGPAA